MSNSAQSFRDWAFGFNVIVGEAEPVFMDSMYAIYDESDATSLMKNMPRFGNSKDLSSPASREEKWDYSVGLSFAFLVILVPFLLWSSVLFHSKEQTGRPLRVRKGSKNFDCSLAFIIRLVFVIACCMLQIASYCMFKRGFVDIDTTKNIFSQSNEEILFITNEAIDITDELTAILHQFGQISQNKFLQLHDKRELCPNLISSFISNGGSIGNNTDSIADLASQLGYDLGDEKIDVLAKLTENLFKIGQQEGERRKGTQMNFQKMLGQVGDVFSVMKEMDSLLQESANLGLDVLREGLQSARNHSMHFSDVVEQIEQTKGVWILVLIPFVIPLIMIVGTVMAHFELMNDTLLCLLSYWFLPLLVIWIILSFVCCAFVAVMAVVNADFCSGSGESIASEGNPDISVMNAMNRSVGDQKSFMYQTARYYVYQCTERSEVDPFLLLRQFDIQLDAGQVVLNNIYDSVDPNELDKLSVHCSRDFVTPVYDILTQATEILTRLRHASGRSLQLVACENVVPIYTNTIYDGVCEHFITGVTWTYFCLIAISAAGMIAITFRSSYQNCSRVFQKPHKQQPQSNSLLPDYGCINNEGDHKKDEQNHNDKVKHPKTKTKTAEDAVCDSPCPHFPLPSTTRPNRLHQDLESGGPAHRSQADEESSSDNDGTEEEEGIYGKQSSSDSDSYEEGCRSKNGSSGNTTNTFGNSQCKTRSLNVPKTYFSNHKTAGYQEKAQGPISGINTLRVRGTISPPLTKTKPIGRFNCSILDPKRQGETLEEEEDLFLMQLTPPPFHQIETRQSKKRRGDVSLCTENPEPKQYEREREEIDITTAVLTTSTTKRKKSLTSKQGEKHLTEVPETTWKRKTRNKKKKSAQNEILCNDSENETGCTSKNREEREEEVSSKKDSLSSIMGDTEVDCSESDSGSISEKSKKKKKKIRSEKEVSLKQEGSSFPPEAQLDNCLSEASSIIMHIDGGKREKVKEKNDKEEREEKEKEKETKEKKEEKEKKKKKKKKEREEKKEKGEKKEKEKDEKIGKEKKKKTENNNGVKKEAPSKTDVYPLMAKEIDKVYSDSEVGGTVKKRKSKKEEKEVSKRRI